MDKKVTTNRQKKEKIVAELSEKVSRAKGMVFAGYQGMTHLQIEKLKKAVKALDADFVATKNTLITLALSSSELKAQSPELQGSTATLFLYGDPVAPLKELAKMVKELNLPSIKVGFLDGKEMTSEEVIKLSSLPSRETLLTQLVFGLNSPISGLHRALNWNIQKIAMTLSALREKKDN
jgi:large subunit ribosomal protein L10